MARVGATWWRASETPEGPSVASFAPVGDDVEVRAYGPGAAWALEHAPRLLGCEDDVEGFTPTHPLVAGVWRQRRWLRIGATDNLMEALAPAVIEQRVTGAEAFASFVRLTRRFGEPAPCPAEAPPLMLPLTAERWCSIPSWEYLRAGVERTRTRTLVLAAQVDPNRLIDRPNLDAALRSLPGIGAWTSARVRQAATGDPDAWSVGDYHVPGLISLALGGDKTLDASELLAPYAGHRYRVEVLVQMSGVRVERHGPRKPKPTHLPW